jgi:hypothetical protein
MPGVLPRHQTGNVTFQVDAADAVIGGQLVESDGASPAFVRTAVAGSKVCIGVATNDAVGSTVSQVPTVPGTASPVINAALVSSYVAVASDGVWPVRYAASAAFGQRMKTAAGGTVTPFTGAETPDELVGICYEPAGVTVTSGFVIGAMRLAGLS